MSSPHTVRIDLRIVAGADPAAAACQVELTELTFAVPSARDCDLGCPPQSQVEVQSRAELRMANWQTRGLHSGGSVSRLEYHTNIQRLGLEICE